LRLDVSLERAANKTGESIERTTRKIVAERLRRDQVIPAMIDKIKGLFGDGVA
jgi:hypothetical protein